MLLEEEEAAALSDPASAAASPTVPFYSLLVCSKFRICSAVASVAAFGCGLGRGKLVSKFCSRLQFVEYLLGGGDVAEPWLP